MNFELSEEQHMLALVTNHLIGYMDRMLILDVVKEKINE